MYQSMIKKIRIHKTVFYNISPRKYFCIVNISKNMMLNFRNDLNNAINFLCTLILDTEKGRMKIHPLYNPITYEAKPKIENFAELTFPAFNNFYKIIVSFLISVAMILRKWLFSYSLKNITLFIYASIRNRFLRIVIFTHYKMSNSKLQDSTQSLFHNPSRFAPIIRK